LRESIAEASKTEREKREVGNSKLKTDYKELETEEEEERKEEVNSVLTRAGNGCASAITLHLSTIKVHFFITADS
jgi:hypothetical protein